MTPRLKRIIDLVAWRYGVSPPSRLLRHATGCGRRGPDPVVLARDEAMWRYRQEVRPNGSRFTLTQVASAFGLKDHTSARTAIARHERRMKEALEDAA